MSAMCASSGEAFGGNPYLQAVVAICGMIAFCFLAWLFFRSMP